MKKGIIFSTICVSLFVLTCQVPSSTQESLSGQQLATIHCASCHVYPEPDVLDRKSWESYILPRMKQMMGLYEPGFDRNTLFENGPGGEKVKQAGIYPESPLVSVEVWSEIERFYLDNAPEKLEAAEKAPIREKHPLFKTRIPEQRFSPPSTTLVHFTSEKTLFFADAHTRMLHHYSNDFNALIAAKVGEGATTLEETTSAMVTTVMGSFSPTDDSKGYVLVLPKVPGTPVQKVVKDLQRPVHTIATDLSGDGLEDLVVSEFGKWTGRLSWWENLGKDGFKDHTLSNMPGAIAAYPVDANADGQQDIIALFGQSNEGIYLFTNNGDRTFENQPLLRFSSSNGSSSFRLFDFNSDGHLDILYTAGDNADFPPILKPYHGIYIFENDGQFNFNQTFFYPLNGAYGAYPVDFDQDGDIDLAAVSFFPDFGSNIREGFVLLENTGGFAFEAYSFPEVGQGRWIVMDVGDLEGDGDEDIILGSLAFEVPGHEDLVQQWVEGGVPFIVLENQLK